MIINYHDFKSINFNSHTFIKINDEYGGTINENRYHYICKKCKFNFYELNETIHYQIYKSIAIFDRENWDIFEEEILSCNEYIIKSIIE